MKTSIRGSFIKLIVKKEEPREENGEYHTTEEEGGEPLMSVHVRMVPRLTWKQNALNALLMHVVVIPALLYGLAVVRSGGAGAPPASAAEFTSPLKLLSRQWWLAVGHYQPVLAVNLVLLFNVDILFWLIYLATGSTWLIDPYW